MATHIWKHRHDGMHWVIGILLFGVPFVFGIAMFGIHVWSAWVLGVVVAVAAIFLAHLWWARHRHRVIEGTTGLVGGILFLAPWVLNGSWPAAVVWACSLLGLLLLVVLADMLWNDWHRQTRSARAAQRDAIKARPSYGRRMEQPR